MRFMRVGDIGGERPVAGSSDGRYFDLSSLTADIDGPFLAGGGVERAAEAISEGRLPELDLTGLRIGAPIARPGKVMCVGLNYTDHADETGAAYPTEPVVFMKAPNTVIGPDDEVRVPPGSTTTDYEVELAIIIARTARYLPSIEAAADIVAGYAISNDVSEREWQIERGGTWDKGKSFETFNPLGPWLVTPEEIGDPQTLGMRLYVNGELRQNGSTAKMIFNALHAVWYISQFTVLEPGDLINTGTPAGVAHGANDFAFLKQGDVIEVEIDKLGRQRQTVGQGRAAEPASGNA